MKRNDPIPGSFASHNGIRTLKAPVKSNVDDDMNRDPVMERR